MTQIKPVGIAVFDLDNTLLNTNSSYRFGSYLYQNKFFSYSTLYRCLFYYACHKWFGMSLEKVHQKNFDLLFSKRSKKTVEANVKVFLDEHLSSMLSPTMLKRLEQAKRENYYIIILSSGPDFLAVPIAKQLGIKECKSTIYHTDKEDNFDRISHVISGQDKAGYVLQLAKSLNIEKNAIIAYTDSHLDLPLLQAVGVPVGVTPDHILRRICIKNQWEII